MTNGSLQHIATLPPSGKVSSFPYRIAYRNGEMVTLGQVVSRVGDNVMTFTTPEVVWLRNGIPLNIIPTNTPESNGRLTTSISFVFTNSDAGVYQCIYTDHSHFEVLATEPTRLDTGEKLS